MDYNEGMGEVSVVKPEASYSELSPIDIWLLMILQDNSKITTKIKEGFQAKLERKRSFAQNCLPKILSSMGISNGEDWQAKAAFVTRYPVAAAYAKASRYPFLTLRNLYMLKTL